MSWSWERSTPLSDRLTTAVPTGVALDYAYDAGGRLLRRVRVPDEGTSEMLLFHYYVGLNRIAEELGGEEAEVFCSSEEPGDGPSTTAGSTSSEPRRSNT